MRPRDPDIPDPYSELLDNLDMLSPVKKCPQCGMLSLKYNPSTGMIVCTRCGFSRETGQKG